MSIIRSSEDRSTFHVILWCIFIYIIFNHVTRALPRDEIDSQAGLSGIVSPEFHFRLVGPLDDFRIMTGDSLEGVFKKCPYSVLNGCRTVGHGLRVVLGLHH